MLTRPGDFWTFKVLVTALSSSMEKGSMLMLRASVLWILGSSCSSELVRVAPRRFLKWSGQFFFFSDLEPPFIRIDGLLLRSVRSLIVSHAETCRWTAFLGGTRSILPWKTSS